MIVSIPSYDCCLYSEVIRVVEMRDGAVYRTESTGKYVLSDDVSADGLPGYLLTSVSCHVQRGSHTFLDVVSISEFQRS